MDEKTTDIVANSERLVSAMGRWPSFHDARVLRAESVGDCCRVSIHVFRMTDQVDERGFYILTNHHVVRLEMNGVAECTLPIGYDGDTLFELMIERAGELVVVRFDSACDPESSWQVQCQEVIVADVAPCNPRGEPST